METAVVQDFKRAVSEQPDGVVAVVAVKVLSKVVQRSQASTIMGLEVELKAAADQISQHCTHHAISLAAACELFNRYVMRTLSESQDLHECKRSIVSRGEQFESMSLKSKKQISEFGTKFIHDDSVILTHGRSRVVLSLLLHAAQSRKNISVFLTEGYPHQEQSKVVAQQLREAGISVTMILDASVAFYMEQVHCVLLGAEGVIENGGIINRIGTYQVCIVAKSLNKPVYIATESFKFARLFPLTQSDFPNHVTNRDNVLIPSCDYTPPNLITLLFTDLGILTPSAVSDELIKLYY